MFNHRPTQLDRVESMLRALLHHHGIDTNMETEIMAALADIKAALDAQSDKLSALAARISEQANSSAPDPAALQAIADELNAHNASIDALDVASVTAPAAPSPAPGSAPAGGAIPVVASLSPTVGEVAGGTKISLNGSGLANVQNVSFGGVDAPQIVADSDSILTVISPPNSAGTVDVVVNTAVGASEAVPFIYA